MSKVNITSPVCRIVMGSLYDAQTTDAEGKPLVVKSGPNAGQPRINYFFAVAIPKGTETHWTQTPWGLQIWNVGNAAFPNAAQSPAFAWKIEDGDSQIPNRNGRKPCDNEGWPGNWIVKFSGGFAPKIYRQEGSGYVQVLEKDFCKPGYYVEVAFSVDGNNSQQQPGVYLNHGMVCFRAYGPEIVFGPDVASAGFGAAPLPPGASTVPLAGTAPLPSAAPVAPPVIAAPIAPPAVAVTPRPEILTPPAPPAPPVAAPVRVPAMTAAANGVPYDQWIAQGWTDALLIGNGYMTA